MEYLDFITYVERAIKRTDKSTEILRAYNDTIMDIAARMPHGNYKYQSYTETIAGKADYCLPSDLMHLIHPVRILDGNDTEDSGMSMDHLTKEEYDLREPAPSRTDPDTSYPTAYAIWSRSIYLTPIPDDTYLIEINWSKIPVDQSEDYTTPLLESVFEETIKWGTLFRLYADLQLYQDATYYRALYEDDLVGLPKLLRREKDIEGMHVRRVQSNPL